MRRPIRCISLLAMAFAPLVHANDKQSCDPVVVDAVAAWAHAGSEPVKAYGFSRDDADIAGACKAMPDTPDITIATMAFGKGASTDTKRHVVALVRNGHVVAGGSEDLDEDAAFSVGDFTIDTARYNLAPGVRAFGVKVDNGTSGPKCADNNADAPLTLWIREGTRLRPVMTTNLWGVHSVVGVTGCTGGDTVSEVANITVAVDKGTSHGFADLVLVAKVKRSRYKDDDEIGTEQRTARQTLHYDGKTYGSDPFREFWYGDDH